MDSRKIASLENCFYEVRKVLLILLPQVVIRKLVVFVFKGFELNIVVNVIRRYKVNSLILLLLTFVDLLAYVCHIV
jgi:hypothetical protein